MRIFRNIKGFPHFWQTLYISYSLFPLPQNKLTSNNILSKFCKAKRKHALLLLMLTRVLRECARRARARASITSYIFLWSWSVEFHGTAWPRFSLGIGNFLLRWSNNFISCICQIQTKYIFHQFKFDISS